MTWGMTGGGCLYLRQSLYVTVGGCDLEGRCDSGRLVSLRPGVVYLCVTGCVTAREDCINPSGMWAAVAVYKGRCVSVSP